MNTKKIIETEKKHIMQTYSRSGIVIDHGKGCYVFDKNSKKYLDLVAGLATCSIGHGNKKVAEAVCAQSKKLLNVTNLYYTEQHVVLAKKLAKISGLSKCFFCNSGAEANEAAIKLARKYTEKTDIIATKHAFHGRTLGALSATWKEKLRKKFEPTVPGFTFVDYNNIKAVEDAITEKTAAVIVEPIQGESGIIMPDEDYLVKLKKLCEKKNILLILDEVQTGTGRTGKFFAYLHYNVKPDIVTVAKGLANGIPIGVMMAGKGIDFDKGDHASTFGGNSLSCAAANATIDFIMKNKLMGNAVKQGNYFIKKLNGLKNKYSIIKEVRGKGLMIGVELSVECKNIANKCLERGLLVNCASEKVLRFLPSLIIMKEEIDEAINILDEVVK
ncbi:MAG: aspartate aminotransferase family protein [Flavobacteriales bacterium]|jgi:acetylornithine/N-succinyldiaminopimelate aminotransferase|nr:aspartate aminotransferase family protein [Flavobacteriales bacterium]|tara:strand:- start:10567 stop:11727 length:1161 start_codon:yes stop_codon:yes gene_type:complete